MSILEVGVAAIVIAATIWAAATVRARHRDAEHTAVYDEQQAAEHLRPLAGIVVIRPVHKPADGSPVEAVQNPPGLPPNRRK